MAELPLAGGLLDLRPCKLSPKPSPPPTLPMPACRSPSRSQATTAIASPRRAVPEFHSTTELADGSIVFHFAHPPAKEPEPEAACPDPGLADASASPQPELGVPGAIVGDPAPVDEANPYMAAAAGEISLTSSDAGPVEAPAHAISSIVCAEAEAGLAGGKAVAADELAVQARGSLEQSETVEAGVTGPVLDEADADADAASTSQDLDTNVDTESSGSSGDEQGATEFGVPIPAAGEVGNIMDWEKKFQKGGPLIGGFPWPRQRLC